MLFDERLTDAAADLVERAGDSAPMLVGLMLAEEVSDAIAQLQRFFRPGAPVVGIDELGAELADVVVIAALLARLVGADLEASVDERLNVRARCQGEGA